NSGGSVEEAERMSRNEMRRALFLWRAAADNTARWIAGTAVYQVGRNSLSQPKKASASKSGGQITLDPAANAATSPEMSPCTWNSGSTLSNRSRGQSAKVVPTLCAERHTAAWVSGTIFGRDEVPEVNRIKASSVSAANASSTGRCVAAATRRNLAGPSLGRG